MRKLKKYLSVAVLLIALPIVAMIGTNFVLESDKTIYKFIPQESDVVIEINTRNFIREMAFQRIFREDYFHESIEKEEVKGQVKDVGFDPFSSIIIFREHWAESSIWMAVVGYTDQTLFHNYIVESMPDVNVVFGEKYALLQLSPYYDKEAVTAHMQSILNGEVKSFKKRIDLGEVFDPSKEVNCYILPTNESGKNQLLSGSLSLDFLSDQIKIEGSFTPSSGFAENPPVAYAIDEEAPFSLRSSLNLLQSIYWFSEDNIKGLPEYSQMAFDYNGMNLFMVDDKLGYAFPFKQYPDLQVKFDITNYESWNSYLQKMQQDGVMKMDTVAKILSTEMGTFFNYTFDKNEFTLARNQVKLQPCNEGNLYFAFHMRVVPLLENIKVAIDQDNPPSKEIEMFALPIIQGQLSELKVMANVEDIRFELKLEDETNMAASGYVQMINRDGHSMIESMSFGMASVLLLADILAGGATEAVE